MPDAAWLATATRTLAKAACERDNAAFAAGTGLLGSLLRIAKEVAGVSHGSLSRRHRPGHAALQHGRADRPPRGGAV